jgi:hypothetical protein
MKISNWADWQGLCAELEDDGPTGRDFRRFVEDWISAAEVRLERGSPDPITALREALADVETERGRISSDYLYQMLVVIISFWVHGEEVAGTLTPFEMRAVQDVLAIKLSSLEDTAAEVEYPIEEIEESDEDE